MPNPIADERFRSLLHKPVNGIMGLARTIFSVAQLAEFGIKRVSLGSSLARAALGAFLRAAREVRYRGHLRVYCPGSEFPGTG